MAAHRIRIAERTVFQSEATAGIDAASPEIAAARLLAAYQDAISAGRQIIALPDGQELLLERTETVETSVALYLVNEAGEVVREMNATTLRRSLS